MCKTMMRAVVPTAAACLFLTMTACTDVSIAEADHDADGYTEDEGDCNDQDSAVHPGAQEICDALDNNCDGQIDEGFDVDEDTYTVCGPDGVADTEDDDCDDNVAAVNPGAVEEACDGIDNDCDPGTGDEPDEDADGATLCEDCDDADAALNLSDEDEDGWTTCEGDCDDADATMNLDDLDADSWTTCDGDCDDDDASMNLDDLDADGFDTCAGDCDDDDDSLHPDAEETTCDGLDNDCDPATSDEPDEDGDGYSLCEDCNDEDPDVSPGQDEVYCDAVDNDCDASTEDTPDQDADGATVCDDCDDSDPALNLDDLDGDLYSTCSGDCDDGNADVHPGAAEVCSGLDDDCDGDMLLSEVDADGDGYLECAECDDTDPALNLDDADGDGYSTCDGDCDDGHAGLDPGDADGDGWSTCDGDCNDADADQNLDDADGDGYSTCDGDCDDDDSTLNLADADGDGVTSCDGDCDDDEPTVYPDATEVCDGLDNNCSGSIPPDESDDDGDGAAECEGDCDDADPDLNLDDLDGDGYSTCDGDCDDADAALNLADLDLDGYDTCAGDCDDDDSGSYPGATELCDGLDNDCDGSLPADEVDADGDGYLACEECEDGDVATYPGAAELCDGADNDCDGAVPADEGDADADGWMECEECDDADADVYPGAPDICDATMDNDCDGATDPMESDDDGDGASECDGDCDDADADLNRIDEDADGYSTCVGDCNDQDASVYPGAPELCDGLDDDCDGLVPSDEVDGDADGWLECEECDDGDVDVYPGAPEVCNGVDDDCDGQVPADELDLDADGYAECEGDCDDGDAEANPLDDDGDGWTSCDGDCDDDDVDVNPDAEEICEDGTDSDCDGFDGQCLLEGTYDLSVADAIFVGEEPSDYSGYGIGSAGDVDGDGQDELIIGAYYNDRGGDSSGAAYLFDGVQEGVIDLSTADTVFVGEEPGDHAGMSVLSAGDLDCDGYDDVLIGAWGQDGGDDNAGAAYVYFGPTASGTVDLSTADSKFLGEGEGDYVGRTVASAGDVDGDGCDDLLLGAQRNDDAGDNAGAAYVLYGIAPGTYDLANADARLLGEEENDLAGRWVSSAGDVDADGHADVLVGSYYNDEGGNNAGAAYLLYGAVYGTIDLSAADAKFIGEANGDYAGIRIASAGDTNGDGYDDVLIGAYMNDNEGTSSGAAYLLLGPVYGDLELSAANAIFAAEEAGDRLIGGHHVGDVNGDGLDDVFIGAYCNDEGGSNAGAAYLLYGPVSGDVELAQADAKFVGEEAEDYAGIRLAGAGDVNGDGVPDLMVGAYYNDRGGDYSGATYLIYGGVL